MPYDWAGTLILQKHTSLPDKRRVLGHEDTLVTTDLREWVMAEKREEVLRVIETLGLPTDRKIGTFDRRARIIWEWVANEIHYIHDSESHRKLDFWQFPAETLALKQGDCEDSSFLLVSLFLAAGISPFCVRVVFGSLKGNDKAPKEHHIWPVYRDESGIWRILESTLDAGDVPKVWPAADDLARPGARPWYRPDICFNQFHVWQVRKLKETSVSHYIKLFK